jgi:pimeloyl-ACP methyl ester carboxylesterase
VTGTDHHVELTGVRVGYRLTGSGPPVVLPHARPFVRWYEPLTRRLSGCTVLAYHRDLPDAPAWGVPDDARLCTRLLAHLGIERPHVVGHSYGGLVALELARADPAAARSLALLEPASTGLLPPAEAATQMAGLVEAARTRGPVATMEQFLDAVAGPDGPRLLDQLVPGALADARTHAERFFAVELPAAIRWSFGPADARAVDVPVLYLRGGASSPRFAQAATIIGQYFPAAPLRVLAGANHLLPAQRPATIAALLARFWAGC